MCVVSEAAPLCPGFAISEADGKVLCDALANTAPGLLPKVREMKLLDQREALHSERWGAGKARDAHRAFSDEIVHAAEEVDFKHFELLQMPPLHSSLATQASKPHESQVSPLPCKPAKLFSRFG